MSNLPVEGGEAIPRDLIERQLVRSVQDGLAAPLDDEAKIASGQRAQQELLDAYLPAVHNATKLKMRKHSLPYNVTKEDLLSCSYIGFLEAIRGFDLSSPITFNDFAFKEIRAAQSAAIRGSTGLVGIGAQHHKTRLDILDHPERDDCEAIEAAQDLGAQVDEKGRVWILDTKTASTSGLAFNGIGRYVSYLDSLNAHASVEDMSDQEINDHMDTTHYDNNKNPVEQEVLKRDTANEIRLGLQALPEDLAAIISYRFGLTDGLTHSLDEVEQEFGIARMAIKRKEAKALMLLRHPGFRGPNLKDQL